MRKLTNYLLGLFAIVALLTFVSCEDDKATPIDPPTADFSAEVSQDFSGTVTFTNTSLEADSYLWDFGDGTGSSIEDNPVYIYAEGGTFTVKLIAVNAGGGDTAKVDVTVVKEAPNLVLEGQDNWTDIAWFNNTVEFGDAGIHFQYTSADAWQQGGIHQSVPVKAGKTYKVDMNCESTSGFSNSWFEAWVGPNAPTLDQDYNGDSGATKVCSINAWEGCGGEAYNGLISAIGCSAESNPGTFTADADGTVYLVIRSGGENADLYGAGVVVTNITFKEVL